MESPRRRPFEREVAIVVEDVAEQLPSVCTESLPWGVIKQALGCAAVPSGFSALSFVVLAECACCGTQFTSRKLLKRHKLNSATCCPLSDTNCHHANSALLALSPPSPIHSAVVGVYATRLLAQRFACPYCAFYAASNALLQKHLTQRHRGNKKDSSDDDNVPLLNLVKRRLSDDSSGTTNEIDHEPPAKIARRSSGAEQQSNIAPTSQFVSGTTSLTSVAKDNADCSRSSDAPQLYDSSVFDLVLSEMDDISGLSCRQIRKRQREDSGWKNASIRKLDYSMESNIHVSGDVFGEGQRTSKLGTHSDEASERADKLVAAQGDEKSGAEERSNSNGCSSPMDESASSAAEVDRPPSADVAAACDLLVAVNSLSVNRITCAACYSFSCHEQSRCALYRHIIKYHYVQSLYAKDTAITKLKQSVLLNGMHFDQPRVSLKRLPALTLETCRLHGSISMQAFHNDCELTKVKRKPGDGEPALVEALDDAHRRMPVVLAKFVDKVFYYDHPVDIRDRLDSAVVLCVRPEPDQTPHTPRPLNTAVSTLDVSSLYLDEADQPAHAASHDLYICVVCSQISRNRRTLLTHCLRRHVRRLSCIICKSRFGIEPDLLRHCQVVHSAAYDEAGGRGDERGDDESSQESVRPAPARSGRTLDALFVQEALVKRFACPHCGSHEPGVPKRPFVAKRRAALYEHMQHVHAWPHFRPAFLRDQPVVRLAPVRLSRPLKRQLRAMLRSGSHLS